MQPDYYKSLQILAAQAVKKGTPDYFERYMLRWFSKTFHTPLYLVKEMELEEVLQAFYEEHYAALDDEKLSQELRELLETAEERSARIKAEEDEELMVQKMVEQADKQNKKLEQVVQPDSKPAFPNQMAVPKDTELPELSQNLKDLIKPDVEMKFVDENDLNRLIESIDALADMKKP